MPWSFLRSISLASLFSSLSIFGWSDLLQILRKLAAFSFAVLYIIVFIRERSHCTFYPRETQCKVTPYEITENSLEGNPHIPDTLSGLKRSFSLVLSLTYLSPLYMVRCVDNHYSADLILDREQERESIVR